MGIENNTGSRYCCSLWAKAIRKLHSRKCLALLNGLIE